MERERARAPGIYKGKTDCFHDRPAGTSKREAAALERKPGKKKKGLRRRLVGGKRERSI